MPAIIPTDLLKEYKETYEQHGRAEAMQKLRQRIIWRTSRRFYVENRAQIVIELTVLETLVEMAKTKEHAK